MPVEAKDGLRFIQINPSNLDDPFESQTEWPRLSCPQANQLTLKFGELRIDESLTVNNAISTQQLSVTGSLTVENDLTVSNAIATNQLSVSGTVTGSLTVENDLTAGGLLTTSGINATGTIQANKFVGDGSQLTNINRWSLAYAHNANGDQTAGNFNDLINAVQNGSQVRILIDGNDQQYATDAENIWIKNGIVYVQNTSHVSIAFDEDVLRFQDNSYWWMIIVSTKGDRDMIRWNVGEHTPRGHTNDKVAVKWFID